MSSLRLALKQSLQESAANQQNDDSDGALSSENEYSTDDESNAEVSATHHSAANKIQSKWKSSAKGRDEEGKKKKQIGGSSPTHDAAAGSFHGASNTSGDYAAVAHGDQRQHAPHHHTDVADTQPDQQRPLAKKKKKARNKTDQDGDDTTTGSRAQTVPHPSFETIELQHNMDPKRARKYVAPGLRVKVRFATEVSKDKKKRKWFGGRISAVSKEGSKIRIRYDDRSTEISRFPDKDVIIDATGNGEHSVRADKFIPRPGLISDAQQAIVAGEQKLAVGQADNGHVLSGKSCAKAPRPDVAGEGLRELSSMVLDTTISSGDASAHAQHGSPEHSPEGEQPVKRKRGRPPKIRPPIETNLNVQPVQRSPKRQSPSPVRSPASLNNVQRGFGGLDGSDGRDELLQVVPSPSLASHESENMEETACLVRPLDQSADRVHGDAVSLPTVVVDHASTLMNIAEEVRQRSAIGAPDIAFAENDDQADLDGHTQDASLQQHLESKAPAIATSLSAPASSVIASNNFDDQATDNGRDVPGQDGPEERAKRLHIHIPAHKLAPHSHVVVETGKVQAGSLRDEAKTIDSDESSFGKGNDPSGLVPSVRLVASTNETGDDLPTFKKRKRLDADILGESDDEPFGSKIKQARNTQDVSANSCVDKAHVGEGGVDSKTDDVDAPVAYSDMAVETMDDMANDSSTPHSRAAHVENIAAFDASIVRSGRRAAQQANERITSRQELVIDSPDGKKGKRKRRREDEFSEMSDDDSQWVQCDSCSKWRIIPSIVVNTLPKKWYCSDNLWDTKRASCDAPEQTPKEVAKEKKKRKKIQQRIRMEADAAAAAAVGSTADIVINEPTPILVGQVDRALTGTLELELEHEKNAVSLLAVHDPTVTGDTHASDTQGRRGRGRPRRVKELAKPVVEPESSTRPQSVAGATDETDNLEWVQCETCQKWRKLPAHISADDLPDLWYCHMNTWNPVSASCDAPEDKADGLQDIGFHTGSGSGKLSYRNLIFGNTGRKPNRPISERARAAESLFIAPNDDEDAPPIVMYANSSAFIVRKKGNPAFIPDDHGDLSILELMSHSSLWAELRAASQPYMGAADTPVPQFAYTYDTLPATMKTPMKEFVVHSMGDKCLTSDALLLEIRNMDGDIDPWSKTRAFCDLNVLVTTLFELAKDGAIDCVQDRGLKDWNPRYRLSRRQEDRAVTVVEAESVQNATVSTTPRLMKISKPWKAAKA